MGQAAAARVARLLVLALTALLLVVAKLPEIRAVATDTGSGSASVCIAPGGAAASAAASAVADAAAVPFVGVPGTKHERSFFAIKPEGLQRGLVGEVIGRFERKGLKLVAMRLEVPSADKVRQHYAEHEGKPFFPGLVRHFSSGPVILMVWEGPNAIAGGRKMLGKTNPLDADMGTIRGDLCVSGSRNLVHASDSPESAAREISLWFQEKDVSAWARPGDDFFTGQNQ